MRGGEMVNGDGWISDDSDFYGNENTRAKLERSSKKAVKRTFEEPFARATPKKVKVQPNNHPPWDCKPEPTASQDALAFLMSRPQIEAMQKDYAEVLQPTKRQLSRTSNGEQAADLLDDHRFPNHPAAWQQSESVADFLRRLPVQDPETARVGPWLWVGNPKFRHSQKNYEAKTDVDAFVNGGVLLLKAFEVQKAEVESANDGKAVGILTRYLRPYREQLEENLLTLAVNTGTTCGKWMLFPPPDDLPRTWRVIAEATAGGKLGPTSKVATPDRSDSKPERVICVYTYDFTDQQDVRRVLDELVNLELCSKYSARGIFYKCDAYTYLDIKSDNQYKIRASLYSSKEMLNDAVKAKPHGPIARLKKRNGTVDSFLAT